MTSLGIGRALSRVVSASSRPAHTRVSRPSTASSPRTKSWCATSKLERRNSLTCDASSTASPNRAGERKLARGVDQRNADDAEGGPKSGGLTPSAGLEQRPGAPVEELEEAAVEDDAGRVAVAPFNRELLGG